MRTGKKLTKKVKTKQKNSLELTQGHEQFTFPPAMLRKTSLVHRASSQVFRRVFNSGGKLAVLITPNKAQKQVLQGSN